MPRLRTAGTGPSIGASDRNGSSSGANGPLSGTEAAHIDTMGASNGLLDANGDSSPLTTKRRTLSNFFASGNEPGGRRDTVQDHDTQAARLSKPRSMLTLGRRHEALENTATSQQDAAPALRASQSVNFESVRQPPLPPLLRKMKSKLNLRETGSTFMSRLNHRPSLASVLPRQLRSDHDDLVGDDSSSTLTIRCVAPSRPLFLVDSTTAAEAQGENSPASVLGNGNEEQSAVADDQAASNANHAKVDSKHEKVHADDQAANRKRNGQLYEDGVDLGVSAEHDITLASGAQGYLDLVDSHPRAADDRNGDGASQITQPGPSYELAGEIAGKRSSLARHVLSDGSNCSPVNCAGTRYGELPQGDDRFSVRSQAADRVKRRAPVLSAFRRNSALQQEEGWVPLAEYSESRSTLVDLSQRLGDFSFNGSSARHTSEHAISPTAGGYEDRKKGFWSFGKGKQRRKTSESTNLAVHALGFDVGGPILQKKAKNLIRHSDWRSQINAGMAVRNVDHESVDDETVDDATRDNHRQAALAALNGEFEPPAMAPGKIARKVETQPDAFDDGLAGLRITTAREPEIPQNVRATMSIQSVGLEDAFAPADSQPCELEDTSEQVVHSAVLSNYERLQVEQPHISVNQFQSLLNNPALTAFRASDVRKVVTKLQKQLSALAGKQAELQRLIVQRRYAIKTGLRHASAAHSLALYNELELQSSGSLVDWAKAYCNARLDRAMMGPNMDWDLEIGKWEESGCRDRHVAKTTSRLTLSLTIIEERDDDSDTGTIKRSSLAHPSISNDSSVYSTMMQRPEVTGSGAHAATPVTDAAAKIGIVHVSMLDRPRGYQRYSLRWE